MSLNDCLCFVHCLFSDEVRPLYEESQTVLSREELDARNSTDKKQTYEDALTLKFNEKNYSSLGGIRTPPLCFSSSFPLPLNDFKMTPERVKDIMMGVKAKLIDLTQRYELLGNGEGQLAENKDHNSDGQHDVIEGSDMKNFLQTPKNLYILYFHYWLSEAGLLEFSLTKLSPSMCASSEAVTTTKKAMKKMMNNNNTTKQCRNRSRD